LIEVDRLFFCAEIDFWVIFLLIFGGVSNSFVNL